MKAKLMSLVAKAKSVVQAVSAKAPLPTGVVIGYLGHAPIKIAIDAVSHIVKGLLG